MVSVHILASEHSLFSTITSPLDMLVQAGVFWNKLNDQPLSPKFEVKVVSIDGQPLKNFTGLSLEPHASIAQEPMPDVLIIPSEGMAPDRTSDVFTQRVNYIKNVYEAGKTVTSICTGAFLLADAGILNGRTATTHWALASEFSKHYPKVILKEQLLIADEGQVITAGGVTSDLNLSMHLIRKFCGQDIALQTSKCTLVDIANGDQSNYASFFVEKSHGDSMVLQCQNTIEKRLSENINVEDLAHGLSISSRTLNRRFKQGTGSSIVNYIQKLRVEKAKALLSTSKLSFERISITVGYENVSFFRRVFQKNVGTSPYDYRKRFYCL